MYISSAHLQIKYWGICNLGLWRWRCRRNKGFTIGSTATTSLLGFGLQLRPESWRLKLWQALAVRVVCQYTVVLRVQRGYELKVHVRYQHGIRALKTRSMALQLCCHHNGGVACVLTCFPLAGLSTRQAPQGASLWTVAGHALMCPRDHRGERTGRILRCRHRPPHMGSLESATQVVSSEPRLWERIKCLKQASHGVTRREARILDLERSVRM